MDQTEKMKIGYATYEINRFYNGSKSISDIIREMIVKQSQKAEN